MYNGTMNDDDELALAEFTNSGSLRAEFGDAATFAAFRSAAGRGLCRVFRRAPDPQATALRNELEGHDEAGWRTCFQRSAALQREFGHVAAFVAYKRAAMEGRARVLARRGGAELVTA